MRNLFIAAVLAGTLMACTLYFADDPTQTGPDDHASELSDRGRGHHHGDAGTDGAGPGGTDAGIFPDGAPPDPDAGAFPDGAPPDPDAGVFPDGRPY